MKISGRAIARLPPSGCGPGNMYSFLKAFLVLMKLLSLSQFSATNVICNFIFSEENPSLWKFYLKKITLVQFSAQIYSGSFIFIVTRKHSSPDFTQYSSFLTSLSLIIIEWPWYIWWQYKHYKQHWNICKLQYSTIYSIIWIAKCNHYRST